MVAADCNVDGLVAVIQNARTVVALHNAHSAALFRRRHLLTCVRGRPLLLLDGRLLLLLDRLALLHFRRIEID